MTCQNERLSIFIGGMRCGSTAINDYLKQHPEVCVHTNKDPHFFSGEDNWQRGWEEYLKGWLAFSPEVHKVRFESSTHYTKYPLYKETAKRIASSDFDVRLIYGVQPPISRIESHFVHNVGKGYLDPSDAKQRKKLLEQAINVSNYEMQIEQYERYFDANQLLVFETRRLIDEPEKVLLSICRFLGIDSTFSFKVIPRRPRRFKYSLESAPLSKDEKLLATEALRGPIKQFEKKYQVSVWDGKQ